MDKIKAKYKKIYQERVLPKKSAVENTIHSYEHDKKLLQDFSVYRERANEELIGGGTHGEKG